MKKIIWMCLAVVMLFSLTACGGNTVQESANVSNQHGQIAADTTPTEVKEDSKDPGKLMIYTAGPKGLAEKILEDFKNKTGIDAEMFQSTTGSVLGRLEAEMNNPIADVVILASWPSALDLKERDLLLHYPEAKHADLLHEGWDGGGYYFGYSASALGVTYNTLLVEEPGQDWIDFTHAEWKGQVNIPDPSSSGSALDFIAGYISNNPEKGWNLFEELKQNEIEVAGANRAALDAVVTGSKKAVLAGVDYMTYADKAKGEPVDIIYPTSGTVINPRPAMILKSSKNVENAKLFIDYLLSDDAQKLVADAYLLPGRTDIPAHPDRLDYQDIPQFKIDWEWMAENQESINEQFQTMFR